MTSNKLFFIELGFLHSPETGSFKRKSLETLETKTFLKFSNAHFENIKSRHLTFRDQENLYPY